MLTLDVIDLVAHELVEDMVASLGGGLGDDTSLLQQVDLDISAGKLAVGSEVDANEFTLC